MNKFFTILLTFLLSLGIKAQTPAFIDDVMFQAFGWDEQTQARVGNEGGLYEFVNSRAGNLKAVGYDMIWLPPPSQSTGGVGYIPKEWFNFTETSWGKEAQLDKMLTNLNTHGIFPIADIVVNHRDGTTNCVGFTNPAFLQNGQPDCDAIVGNDESCTGALYTPCGPAEFGYEGIQYGRDLNHANINVQNAVKEYLTRLKNKGFKGWRWDVAKGFPAQYFGLYINASNPYYSVGEYWDGNANTLKSWIDGTNVSAGTSGAFDFGNYYALSNAVRNNSYGGLNAGGRMPGLVNIIGYDSKAVTFVDNHDTFVKPEGILGDQVMKGYAYILTHPGIPCVFASHYYGGTYSKDGVARTYVNNQQKINELIAIRKAEQIDAWSNIEIARADGIYAAYIRKRFGDAQPVVAVKIGPGNWDPAGSGWNLASFGTDYAVWTKKTVNTPPIISMTAGGTFAGGTTRNVVISATDNGTALPNSSIFYTTNGTTPTTSSTPYTGAIPVTSNQTIKAIAVDSQGLSSGVIEMTYNFVSTGTINIYFKPPTTWTAPKIHYWDELPKGTLQPVSWTVPVNMTADATYPGYFKYTFNGVSQVSFLFRSALPTAASGGVMGTNKTGDIKDVKQDTWYSWDSTSATFVKVDNLSTENISSEKKTITLSPNPTADFVEIKSSSEFKIYQISSLEGSLVSNGIIENNKINLSNLKSGIYFVKLISEEGDSYIEKVIRK